ncbi:tyrosine--tRNA ligase [Candidatus Sneabacter namystus]|uniref:Tyrosine--tRNA ligase n=1 Tax=Candidatus Sneabacter namystus TaxID=2601646 RepID=A0A5C0UJQ3_9RICK|nr:tyrosine--tRNA ligase [Candidatus Sneabacter namystus]QEK39753.1 tyrosine--tRNA ligase [Candidatus Sneabacter namystus]
MSNCKGFTDSIRSKGFIYQCTNENQLFDLLAEGKVTFYVGFDCTAPSLHIGNLLTLMLTRFLQKYGNKPIILLGRATSKIGDPILKTETRPMLEYGAIDKNAEGIKKSISKFVDFDGRKNSAVLVDNDQWLGTIKYLDVLREYGKYVSLSKMLSMETVKNRLNSKSHISFLEFNYPILQSLDFLHLNKMYDCSLQIGGSDQWGNIIAGVELIHKILNKKVYGLTLPLLSTSSGTKMGKSEKGAVWLNEELLNAYEYFQYWRNIEDKDIIRFAKLYGEYSEEEECDLKKMAQKDKNMAKQCLALKITTLCHGKQLAQEALQTSLNVFANIDTKDHSVQGLPIIKINKNLTKGILSAYEIVKLSGLASSNSQAKRLILEGAVKIDGIKVLNPSQNITCNDKQTIIISVGKKKHISVKIYQ